MRLLDIYTQYPILIDAIKYINEHNPSNNNPYHSIDHLFTVFSYACDVSEYNKCDNRLELLIAALFHDYGHVGKMGDDGKNITVACDAIEEFHKNYAGFDLKYAQFLIKCTQYPYVIEYGDLTEEAKIIRDCDMSYLFEDISIVKNYYGLRTEFGFDLDKFISMQSDFMNKLEFYDDILAMNWKNVKEIRLAELALLSDKNIPND